MSPTWIRWMLAVIVVVVLGGTIVGIGEGGDNGKGAGATKPSKTQVAAGHKALVALGPVAAQGRKVFGDNGCGGCHQLADAKSGGAIGPDLDAVLSASSLAEIKEDIVDPGAQGTPGYPSGRMPDAYGKQISPTDLDALVKYLQAATSGK